MSGSAQLVSPRRRAGGFVVGLFYVLTAAVLPTLHAETEALFGARTVEDGHSSQCSRIHDDARCATAGALRGLSVSGTPVLRVPGDTFSAAPPASRYRPPALSASGPPSVRGPPHA